MKEIDDLRAELDGIDDQIVDLAARRLAVVARIGALKAQNDRALFDRERERVVLERARRRARERGIPEEVGEAVVHTLVEAFILVSLATDVADPVQRLMAIHASAASGKKVTGQAKSAIPTDFPSFGAPWLMSGLALLYGRSRLADKLPPLANVVISNVPGPQVPLYLAGAKIATYTPVSIPAHGMALNITVQSYNGVLEFGLTACRRAVPDIGDLADCVANMRVPPGCSGCQPPRLVSRTSP